MVKRVAVINDLSGLGKCSLTAAIPILSVMGVQACPLPTAILSNQTGYESYSFDDFTSKMDAYIEEWKKRRLTLDGIYTGFLGSELQIEKMMQLIQDFSTSDTLVLVDPVMGDGGRTYDIYTEAFGRQMKKLIQHADVITPNLTELCLLTDTDYSKLTSLSHQPDYLENISQIALPLLNGKLRTIIVTGILYQHPQTSEMKYYNLVLNGENHCHFSSQIYGGSYSGTGDLLASIVCAGMVRGNTAEETVALATGFLETALQETSLEQIPRNDGINFEPYLKMLLQS